jgi:hypothetical protein
MLQVQMKPLAELMSLTQSGSPLAGVMSAAVVRERTSSTIRPPQVQTGSTDCPPIRDFAYPQIVVAEFENAIVTQTGAVIVNDRFVIEETVEGSLESNGFASEDGKCWFDDSNLEVLDEDITNFCKFGIFNYSIFVTEIMPCAYLMSLNAQYAKRRFYIHFPGFMSEGATALRWEALGACGFSKARSFTTSKMGLRARRVSIAKVNDRYKNHRANLVTPSVASMLRMVYADPYQNTPRRIYIHRQGVARSVDNFESMLALLRTFDVEPVSLESLSIRQQVNLFSKADVVAEHGAGLVNTIFMRPGSTVVEVFPEPLIGRWAFRLIAHLFKLNYNFNSFAVPLEWRWDSDPIHLDTNSIQALLKLVC